MVIAKNKRELENAIKAGNKEIYISGKRLQAACYLVSKYQGAKESIMNEVGCNLVVSGTAVIVTITICLTAVTIFAMTKKYNIKIIYDGEKIEVKYKNDNNTEK